MSLFGLFTFGSVLVLLQLVPGIQSWGREGHYITCKIAENLLAQAAAQAVKSLLPDYANGDLAAVCSWPDEISHRAHWRWSASLHYIDTPDFRCNYEYCRDCHDFGKRKNRCVAGAIYNYSAQLSVHQDPDLRDRYNLTEALLFLSHFIGDIHQPLHCGFLGDEGGNAIRLRWYGRKTNLHHIWDTLIIESALTKYKMDLSRLIEGIGADILGNWANDVPAWEGCGLNQTVCPNCIKVGIQKIKNNVIHSESFLFGLRDHEIERYAAESIRLACKFAYKNASPGSNLGDEYFFTRLPIVQKRLAQGGVRLAATLNRIFLGGRNDGYPDCGWSMPCGKGGVSRC